MVDAQYRLVKEGLGIRHLRLVIGNSMGGYVAFALWRRLKRVPWVVIYDFFGLDAMSPTPVERLSVYILNRMWGGGPRGIPDVGSFKDIIQPKLLEVFNAPNMETYCDDLTKVFPLSQPWPYPDIRYYNLYKPATSDVVFDFRTWLVGFEYINNQPYLYAMVTIIWEP